MDRTVPRFAAWIALLLLGCVVCFSAAPMAMAQDLLLGDDPPPLPAAEPSSEPGALAPTPEGAPEAAPLVNGPLGTPVAGDPYCPECVQGGKLFPHHGRGLHGIGHGQLVHRLWAKYHDDGPSRPYPDPYRPDLFYNFYAPHTANGGTPAHMYVSPVPTPPLVGHTYYTYQPMMPHELMYPHHRIYHRYYNGGKGLNRTIVDWQRKPVASAAKSLWEHLEIPR